MFQSARLTLTAWYLLIIMLVSGTFSVAFYQASTYEIQRVIDRIKFQQIQQDDIFYTLPAHNAIITLDELQAVKNRLQISLLIVNGIILLLAGGAGYFLAGRTLRPIQKMVEEQNQFISNASHELRTPIATLRAEMEGSLLEKKISGQVARNLIHSNLEELGRLQELSDNLLRLTSAQSNGMNHTDVVSLSEVLQIVEKKILPGAKKKNIHVTIDPITAFARGDKQRLAEVFINLFDNAIKYSPEYTSITIKNKIKHNIIVFRIKDQGIGISEKDITHIFERFYRADKSRTLAEGYGLGLSIVMNIVRAHNGTITVTSSIGKGTTFILSLPLTKG